MSHLWHSHALEVLGSFCLGCSDDGFWEVPKDSSQLVHGFVDIICPYIVHTSFFQKLIHLHCGRLSDAVRRYYHMQWLPFVYYSIDARPPSMHDASAATR